jgi:hypothetical protein
MVRLYANHPTANNGAFVLGPKRLSVIVGRDRLLSRYLDQFPAKRMRHGFNPIVRAELLIDVVKVVSERLRANFELTHDVGWTLPF